MPHRRRRKRAGEETLRSQFDYRNWPRVSSDELTRISATTSAIVVPRTPRELRPAADRPTRWLFRRPFASPRGDRRLDCSNASARLRSRPESCHRRFRWKCGDLMGASTDHVVRTCPSMRQPACCHMMPAGRPNRDQQCTSPINDTRRGPASVPCEASGMHHRDVLRRRRSDALAFRFGFRQIAVSATRARAGA